MQFESPDSERQFRKHFHTQRITQDRVFALTQVAIVVLLSLRTAPTSLTPAIRLLFSGTHAFSAVILLLSTCLPSHTYALLRPYILVAARIFYDLLCPQLVWQLAAQPRVQESDRDNWPGFFLLWVTWSRWGSQLLTQVGYLLPFDLEAMLSPFGAILDMLNNKRLCRLLVVRQVHQRPFYRRAFIQLVTRLAVPFEILFAAGPQDCHNWDLSSSSGGSGGGSSSGAGSLPDKCAWNICTAAAAGGWSDASTSGGGCGSGSGGGCGSGGGDPAHGAAADDIAACYCETMFSLSQLLLSLLLPLLVTGYVELRQRWRFAAAARAAAAAEAQRRGERRTRRQLVEEEADWSLCLDGMRLLALLALIQFRIFLSLRFGIWEHRTWNTPFFSSCASAYGGLGLGASDGCGRARGALTD